MGWVEEGGRWHSKTQLCRQEFEATESKLSMTASDRRPTLGGKESRSCELQVSNGQLSFKSDEHNVEEWSAPRAQRSALMPLRSQRGPAGSASAFGLPLSVGGLFLEIQWS